jgi:hypothetical protein
MFSGLILNLGLGGGGGGGISILLRATIARSSAAGVGSCGWVACGGFDLPPFFSFFSKSFNNLTWAFAFFNEVECECISPVTLFITWYLLGDI